MVDFIPSLPGNAGGKKGIMVREKALTYEEFIALAQENYNRGGDVVVECWDQRQFDYYVKEFGAMTKTKALQTFRLYKAEQREQAAMARW